MAFHPFKHFRKRQKVYLAILTIVTMIIFVAQFGAGDPFTRLQQWIGMTAHHGEPVLNLYGKKVYAEDLDKLRWRRQLASEFVFFGTSGSMSAPLQKSLAEIEKKFGQKTGPTDLPNLVQSALQQMMQAVNAVNMAPPEGRLQPLQMTLAQIQRQMGLSEVQKNPDQYRALDTIATHLSVQAWAVDPQRRQGDFYFGGTPRTEDLLDFMVWKQQADRLGIVLTSADVCREINRSWGNGDFIQPDEKFDANEYVLQFFRFNQKIHKSLTPRELLAGLTDEFRVAMAREAILGTSAGVRSYREAVDGIHYSPSVATPDEFYRYFQDRRTTLSVSMLSLPVRNYVDKVKEQAKPSETDLRNLYARYREDEPAPTRRQPGFKEPRRIKVEYFSYRPEGEFAKKLAAKATELLPVFRVAQPVATYPAGGGLTWAVGLAVSGDLDAFIRAEYEKYRGEESARVLKYDRDEGLLSQSNARFGQGVTWSNRADAERQAPAAMVGQLLGDLATGGTPLAAPVSWMATNELYERATLTAFASTVLAGANTSPFAAATLPTRYYHSVQPMEAVRTKMIERFETTLARRAMENNVQGVRKELDKLLASHSEQKLNEYLKKAVADFGIENFHAMKETQTRQEILDNPDPVLKDLREAYDDTMDNPFMIFGMSRQRPDFVSALFHSFELSNLERQFGIERPVRSQQFRSRAGDVVWVYWRAEDKPAHPQAFEVVREQVKDAWYLEQARKLAREDANRINEELAKKQLNPEDALKFLVEQNKGRVFQLDNVAHLVAPVFNLPGQKFSASTYHEYVPPKEEIAYPSPNFVSQLLKLKKRGESEVITDQPVRHFYVAVLRENPQLPERREFYEVYNSRGQDNKLWSDLMETRQKSFEQRLLEQMRAEATKSLDGGDYVLPDNLRGRGESSTDSSEG